MIVEEATYLEHYGKKGMKWGSRKTPSESRLAKREAKGQKFDAKAARTKGDLDKVDARLETVTRKYYRDNLLEQKKALTKQHLRELKNADASRAGKMTSGQKKTVAATAALGAAGIALIVKHQGDVKVSNLRKENADFVAARMKLDEKTKTRMSALKDYSNKTKDGADSAAKETEILRNFYENQVNKMMKKHSVDPTAVKKMKLKPPF